MPAHVAAISITGGAIDVSVLGDYAYVTSFSGHGVEILDISTPTSPASVGRINDNNDPAIAMRFARGIAVVGDYAYVASAGDDGVEILDISGRYSTDSPYVTISTPQTFVTTIDSFTETPAVDNEGTVSYQVSPDNGTTWNYWNGTAWTTTTQTGGTETSPASDINANIATLDTDGGNFLWRAYLVSNGTQKVELDQIDSTKSLYFSPPMRHGKRFLNEVLQPYIKEN